MPLIRGHLSKKDTFCLVQGILSLTDVTVDEPEMELKLSSELVPNLRSVKPEGNLLEDRYRSMQMRNLVEPRAKVNKKKTKKKKFEKKSFREITV
ncbi:hypothetical protein V1264_009813 [Littorina saxatilis]|uniref:Ribosome biogenesis protein NOP53 n=1 Tax=Littorina saxatilis TaxID=31220 RepID=A0AAN9AN37_9CAEN